MAALSEIGLFQNVASICKVRLQVPTGAVGAFKGVDFDYVRLGKMIKVDEPSRESAPAPSRPVCRSRLLTIVSQILGEHYICLRRSKGDARLVSISVSDQPYSASIGGFAHLREPGHRTFGPCFLG